MSDTDSTQAPDEPLHPHTLRVADDVLYQLARNTPAGERYEGLMLAHNELRALLATANPRARVVVLPEQVDFDSYGDDQVAEWPAEVGVRDVPCRYIYIPGGLHTMDEARTVAASALAAAEFVGGTQ